MSEPNIWLATSAPDDADAESAFEEAGTGSDGPEAPWAPLPTWLARQFRQEEPDAAPEFIFPTVYEENRSEKIRDLTAAKAENWITHRRTAEQGVKELGFERYDYDEEQDAIAKERKAGIGAPALGGGDDLAKSLGLGGPPAAKSGAEFPPTPPAPPQPGPVARATPAPPAHPPAPKPTPPAPPPVHETPPKRAQLSSPEEREFRHRMRQAEEAFVRELEGVTAGLRTVRESLAEPTVVAGQAVEKMDRIIEGVQATLTRLGQPPVIHLNAPAPPNVEVEVHPPEVHVAAPEVHVDAPEVHVAAPAVEVHPPEVVNIQTPPHERRIVDKQVKYDAQGRAVRVIETDDLGERRFFRVRRGPTGRMLGLDPEEQKENS
jgi:hypothetical protein